MEVLSPSTEEHDRGEKLDNYRRIPSLKAVLLIASEQREITLWSRVRTAGRASRTITSIRSRAARGAAPLSARAKEAFCALPGGEIGRLLGALLLGVVIGRLGRGGRRLTGSRSAAV